MRKTGFLFLLMLLACATSAQDFEAGLKKYMRNTTGIPYGSNKAAGKFYNIRGFQMYTETYGKGQPLLIIHGNGGSINNFTNQIPFFSKKYKVVLADSRAQGKSKDPADSLSYEMMADDFASLLDAMKIDSAYIIGWSDGGINGLLLAMRHPQKVKKLAVTGANLWPDSTAIASDVADLFMPSYTALRNNTRRTPQEKEAWKLTRLLVEEPNISLQSLHSIAVPCLIIGGDHDIIKPEHTLQIWQNIPNAYLWILPNSGHSTPLVYSDEFNRKVDAFFSKPYRRIEKDGRIF